MRAITDFPVKGKRVLIRADLNSSVVNGRIVPGPRIEAHARSIRELSRRGARVIVLAHQGRKGDADYLPLEQHAKLLHHMLQTDVIYCSDLTGPEVKEAIGRMKDGNILVLENVRSLDCETDESVPGRIVAALSPVSDYFVLDALSVAHRKHSSVVEFMDRMPAFAGPVLAEELEALEKVRHSRDVTFFLGGSKVEDSFGIMKKWLAEGKVRKVLVGGALATLLLHARGHKVADSMGFLKSSSLESHCNDAKWLLKAFEGRIVLPVDVGLSIAQPSPGVGSGSLERIRQDCDVDKISRGEIWDIGPKTAELYREAIFNSHAIIVNGPAGVYEIDDYAAGTRAVLEAVARSDAFSLLGGGHTITALRKFNIEWRHFGYVSLAGKALIEYLSGRELPGLKALEGNERKFEIKK